LGTVSRPKAYQERADEEVLFADRQPVDTPGGRAPGGARCRATPSRSSVLARSGLRPCRPGACAPARLVLVDLHDRRPEPSRELGADATIDHGVREQALAGG
jgi:hypothetical protein